MNKICRGHYAAGLTMLLGVLEVCPEELWALPRGSKPPLGQHVYHALAGSWIWFRNPDLDFQEPPAGEAVAELKIVPDQPLSKEEVRIFAREVEARAEAFFARIGEDLTGPFALYGKGSNLDIVLSQVRHIQHHVGYCNQLLSEQGLKVPWRGR